MVRCATLKAAGLNLLRATFGMPFTAEAVGKIKRIKSVGGKKAKCDNTITQYRMARIMIVNE